MNRAGRRGADLGRASTFLVVSSIGVLLVALAYADGRDGIKGALTLYWIGQVVVFTPVAARLLWRRTAGTTESFLLVMGLATNQYLLKWMYSPDQFRFPDELQHWLATTVLMRTGALFQPNPALPPAVNFPGLAEMGAAVADLTGLPVTAAGMLVAGLAHLLFVATLFALVLRISGSPAVAGVACVVYATALHYLFFNSMYLYATGALPFLMVTVWAVQRWRAGAGRAFAGVAVVGMVAATATHHVTAFMLVASLTLVGAAEFVLGRPRRWSAFAMPATAFAVVAGWIAFVAPDVVAYLQAPVDEALHTVAVLLDDKPVEGTATTAAVSLVQLAVQGAGLLVLFALYLGVGADMLRRRDRDTWRWAALVGGGIFFAGNGVRFLGQNGPEIAGRLNTFTYVPISIVAGIALVQVARLIPRRTPDGGWLRGWSLPDAPAAVGPRRAMQVVAAAAGVTLLMVGARMGGWPPASGLLPGPYLVAGYERSVDAPGVAAAEWQRTALGPGHRVTGDVTAVALSSTYGMQDPVRESAPLFYADVWTAGSDQLVRDLAIEYVVVDRRLSTQLPALDAYFEHDPLAGRHSGPLTIGELAKFDGVPQLDRLYDNGDIRIYRTGGPPMTASMTSARVLGVATAIAAAAVVAGPAAVAVPGGLLLAFALPGLALTGVVFRRHELSGVERVVLAPALSLATLILSGLLMNAVGIDLDRLAWTSAAAGVTLLALFAGVFSARGADRVATGGPAAGGREPALAAAVAARAAAGAGTVARAPAFSPEDTVRLVVVAPVTGEERTAPARDTPAATAVEPATGDAGPRPLVRQLLPLVLAVLVAGGAGWLSYDSSRGSATRTVTTLSSTAPGALSAAGTHVVRVTAGGLTPAEGPFTIDVRGDVGRSLERRAVTPVDGAWTAELSLPGRERVTISLLRGTDTTPYRSVVIAAAG